MTDERLWADTCNMNSVELFDYLCWHEISYDEYIERCSKFYE